MKDYKSYYYVTRKGKGVEIYSTLNSDWVHIRCFYSFADALKYKEELETKIKNEKQTRA